MEEPDQARMLNPTYMSTTHSIHAPMNSTEVTKQFEPTFVQLDRQVLRFNAYYREPVVESRLEHFRIIRLIVYCYLEDHTISIIEPRKMNSGKPQGAFLGRTMVLRDDQSGVCILPDDLRVGGNAVVLGKNIRLTDCDDYSREFYQINNMLQGPPEEIPTDPFVESTRDPGPLIKDAAMKDFLEKSLGGGRPRNEKQFLDNDRRVLRFFCTSGENFILLYYLADDTVEILERHFSNDGKRDFPVFLRRSKLPKKFAMGQPGQTPQGDHLQEHEIEPDMTIQIFGRLFQIDSADEFTANYYKEHYSRIFPLGPVPIPSPQETDNVRIPAHDGIGSEEDSLGYVYRLIPKPPNKDYFKFIDNSSMILRWIVRFNNPTPEDVDRRFILSYFLNDDTLQIQERPQRNSGIMEGKFLIRNRYKSELNDQYFRPHDFLIDKDVTINRYRLHIESCDEYTRKYMQGTYNIF